MQEKSEVKLPSKLKYEPATKIEEMSNEKKVNKEWNKQVHRDRTYTKDNPEKIN